MIQYDGLHGEANPAADVDYLVAELLETRCQQINWIIQPHSHAHLFQIFLSEVDRSNFGKVLSIVCYVDPVYY